MPRLRAPDLDARALARLTAFGRVAALAACMGVLSCNAPATPPAQLATIRLTSEAFQSGYEIPTPYTCDGRDLSPDLQWFGLPEGTIELAIVMEDPDARGGTFVHWVVFGIAPSVVGFGLDAVPAGVSVGRNDFGVDAYRGPCPPRHDDPHRYVFSIYALRGHVPFQTGDAADRIVSSIDSLAIGRGVLIGLYARG